MKMLRRKRDSVARRSSQGGAVAAKPRRTGLSVERLLQVNIAVLVPLGAVLLGMGEHGMTLPAIALVVTISANYLTDQWGWIRLSRLAANGLALVATAFALTRFFHAAEEQLTSIANLLVYLQLIMLFQPKTLRLYWQVFVLSVLQVVVATALNSSILFGVMLVVYLFVALATLGLIFILRESERHLARCAALSKQTTPQASGRAKSSLSRWPLARRIEVLPAAIDDLPRQILGTGMTWRTARIGLGTLFVAIVCFLFLPRFGRALVDTTGTGIGYNPTVKLGDLGPLLQNPELVMQVEFFDSAGQFVEPAAPPLLRGSVLNFYHQGEWKLAVPEAQPPMRWHSLPTGAEFIRERVTIQPMHDPVLFGVYPVYRSDGATSQRRVRYDPVHQQLLRSPVEMAAQQIEYEVLTTGLAGHQQAKIVPEMESGEHLMRHLLQLPDEPAAASTGTRRGVPPTVTARDRLTGLREFAARKILEQGIAADNHYAKAKLLERALSGPPFEYTLDREPSAPGIDPIEDFVTRNPRGHCEYFASALALMLRSQGIPARMVIGFHGGDFIPNSSCYDVRQLHAHAWVEAYLGPEQLKKAPAGELPRRLPPGDGAWLVLDPTPPTQIADTFAQGSLLSSLADLSDSIQIFWNTYVIRLDSERQDRAIYQPLADLGHAVQQLASDPKQAVSDVFSHFWHWLFGGGGDSDSHMDWYVVAALVLLLVAMYIVYRATRGAVRIVVRFFKRGRARAAAKSRIEFYRRFEALLARHGLRRAATETPLELARRASTVLSARGAIHVNGLPSRLVAAFYDIRYGQKPLDRVTAAALEQSLDEFAGALSRAIKARS
jgi:hypothetical protein